MTEDEQDDNFDYIGWCKTHWNEIDATDQEMLKAVGIEGNI
jgi:hypothetical protein